MPRFCTRCGRALGDGEVCQCSTPKTTIDLSAGMDFFEKMKNDMGIGDPELNKGDAYEKGKQIVPDCIKANEGEIPVKQYKIATLRNRIFGIPFMKAIGRLQVTNKRVIFRAPGRSIVGRTTLQHEFAIDEIAGIEARREYIFDIWDFIFGCIVFFFGFSVSSALVGSLSGNADGILGLVLLSLVIGVAGCIPFFRVKRKWLLKLLCLGASMGPLSIASTMLAYMDHTVWSVLFYILAFIVLVFTVIATVFNFINPNLVLVIKTKSASDAVDIRRRRVGIFGMVTDKDEHTGYAEIRPEEDAEISIREIGALINDIQKLGDFGIEKWKA
ncbi:MAG: hypothetical protein Q4G23_10625 [Clostridia bacterium]|nr:hypothetical protein [Clostridia bacterium]